MFFGKKLPKNLEGIENSCTFASAFAQKLGFEAKNEFFERFTQTEVVQEASAYYIIGTWVEETNRLILEILDSRSETETRPEIIQFSEQREQSSSLELPSRERES